MLNNFIYAKTKTLFEEALNNGEVLDEAIVFIEDTKEIWNHGQYYGSSGNLDEILERLERIEATIAESERVTAAALADLAENKLDRNTFENEVIDGGSSNSD